jgi:hypothetical protein
VNPRGTQSPEDPYARIFRRREEQRRRRRRTRVTGLLTATGLLAAGIYLGTSAVHNDPVSSRTSADSTSSAALRSSARTDTATAKDPPVVVRPPIPAATTGTELLTVADRASFRALEQELGGTIGLAVSPIGLDQTSVEVGTLKEGVAWSTIKVPIALAVETRTQARPSASEQSLLTRAITASDNAAAEQLWSSLGSPSEAAYAVGRVMAATGDSSTNVQTRVLRPGFTSFGQTQWSLASQQRFIAGLPCLAYSEPVLSLMRQIVPDQRWGLGALPAETEFKGGWGPDPAGPYLVRQMGVVRLANGRSLAASIATMPADGTFATGTANLTRIARWLMAHVDPQKVSPSTCAK